MYAPFRFTAAMTRILQHHTLQFLEVRVILVATDRQHHVHLRRPHRRETERPLSLGCALKPCFVL